MIITWQKKKSDYRNGLITGNQQKPIIPGFAKQNPTDFLFFDEIPMTIINLPVNSISLMQGLIIKIETIKTLELKMDVS